MFPPIKVAKAAMKAANSTVVDWEQLRHAIPKTTQEKKAAPADSRSQPAKSNIASAEQALVTTQPLQTLLAVESLVPKQSKKGQKGHSGETKAREQGRAESTADEVEHGPAKRQRVDAAGRSSHRRRKQPSTPAVLDSDSETTDSEYQTALAAATDDPPDDIALPWTVAFPGHSGQIVYVANYNTNGCSNCDMRKKDCWNVPGRMCVRCRRTKAKCDLPIEKFVPKGIQSKKALPAAGTSGEVKSEFGRFIGFIQPHIFVVFAKPTITTLDQRCAELEHWNLVMGTMIAKREDTIRKLESSVESLQNFIHEQYK